MQLEGEKESVASRKMHGQVTRLTVFFVQNRAGRVKGQGNTGISWIRDDTELACRTVSYGKLEQSVGTDLDHRSSKLAYTKTECKIEAGHSCRSCTKQQK